MKNITIAKSPKEKTLHAIDAYLNNKHRLISFCLKDHILYVLGGPEHCLNSAYDTRDAVKLLMKLAENAKDELYYDGAQEILMNLLQVCDSLIEDPYVEAELTQWLLEREDSKTVEQFSDEHLDIITRQYQLKLQLAALDAEERHIRRDLREEKKAA